METVTIIILILCQYSVLIYLLLKHPKIVNEDSQLGVIMWIPILGPLSVIITIAFITVVIMPFLLPVLIVNLIIWTLNKLIKANIKYIY